MYIYVFESLATTFREYKTLRMSEFYGMSDILLNPQPKLAITEDNSEEIDNMGEDEKLARAQMAHFYNTYKGEFNVSQRAVLKRVAEMPENDILLIQGPPGTGKTHTVTGIISMLIGSGARKIHICAPSNAAVDEILARLSQ